MISKEDLEKVQKFGTDMVKFHGMPEDAQEAYISFVDKMNEHPENMESPEGKAALRLSKENPMQAAIAHRLTEKITGSGSPQSNSERMKARIDSSPEAFAKIASMRRLTGLTFGTMLVQCSPIADRVFRYAMVDTPVMFMRYCRPSEFPASDFELGEPVNDDDIIIAIGIDDDRIVEYPADSRYFRVK